MGKRTILVLFALCLLWGCAEKPGGMIDMRADSTMDCPTSPNCVSSQATNPERKVEPFQLKQDNKENWLRIQAHISSMPGTRMINCSDTVIHAECKSRLFGFIDDLTLKLDPLTGKIDIRSAARTGYYDFGVNIRRITRLREQLESKNMIEIPQLSPVP